MTELLVPAERIISRIIYIRGQKVLLDVDIAKFYGVTAKRLNEQVKRNKRRFPKDFMFQLYEKELLQVAKSDQFMDLRSQIATSSWGGRRYRPYVFTEQGVAMLASVLRSERAIDMSILIVRTFVQLRKLMQSNSDLEARIISLENGSREQKKLLRNLYTLIDKLIVQEQEEEQGNERTLGFVLDENKNSIV